jgi:hypothetical protein
MDGARSGVSIATGQQGARSWRVLLEGLTDESLALAPGGTHVLATRITSTSARELLALPLEGDGPTHSLAASGIAPGKGMAITHDGRRIAWSTCRGRMGIVAMVGGTERAFSNLEWEDLDAAPIPGGQLAVISDRGGDAKPWIIDPKGRIPPRAMDMEGVPREVGASSDGKELVVATDRGLVMLEVASGARRQLTKEPTDCTPSFRQGDREVLFARSAPTGGLAAHRISVAGGDAIPIGPSIVDKPAAIPSSDDFVYLVPGSGSSTPMVWDAAQSRARSLSIELPPARYARPQVSRDGRTIAIVRGNQEIVLVDFPSGRIVRSEKFETEHLASPLFDSEGNLFAIGVRWNGDIWVADLPPN